MNVLNGIQWQLHFTCVRISMATMPNYISDYVNAHEWLSVSETKNRNHWGDNATTYNLRFTFDIFRSSFYAVSWKLNATINITKRFEAHLFRVWACSLGVCCVEYRFLLVNSFIFVWPFAAIPIVCPTPKILSFCANAMYNVWRHAGLTVNSSAKKMSLHASAAFSRTHTHTHPETDIEERWFDEPTRHYCVW